LTFGSSAFTVLIESAPGSRSSFSEVETRPAKVRRMLIMKASIHRHPRQYALATLVSLLVLTPLSDAEIVYTPANVTLSGNGYIIIPQNGGTREFAIQEITGSGDCGVVGVEFHSLVTVTPTAGNGVVAIDEEASTLRPGTPIGPDQNFYGAQTPMADEYMSSGPPPCGPSYGGYWCNEDSGRLRPCFAIDAYLGLEAESKGNTYYGWAHFVFTPTSSPHPNFEVQLTGYAYETVPGQPINAGQTSDNVDDSSPR
jgi:hypothetical protein